MPKSFYKEIPLNSKLQTKDDPTTIDVNFQELKNMRYEDKTVKGIGGMTKINTTQVTDNPHFQNGFHFKKDQPSESHVLVQAVTSADASPKIVQIDHSSTDAPNQVDFTGGATPTALYTEDTNAGITRFADAPNGQVVACNGKEALIWGGVESKFAKFVNYNPDGSLEKDFTDELNNNSTDSIDTATLTRTAAGTGTGTEVLHHFDNSGTDSSADADHTLSLVGDATYSTTKKKFGTHSLKCDGTGDWATMADDTDFDLSGGTWTIDCWVNLDDLSTEAGIYSQATTGGTVDFMYIYIDTDGSVKLQIDATTTKVSVSTPASVVSATTWTHIAVVESGDNYYIFVDGVVQGYGSDTDRAVDYNSLAYIGVCHDGTANNYPFQGYIDEFRLSTVARWTSDFELPLVAYGDNPTLYAYIGTTRPIQGMKITMGTTKNASASGDMVIYEWTGSAWSAVSSLSDGTDDGTRSLAQTGTISFTSTATTSKVRELFKDVLYYYRITVDNCDDSVIMTQITINYPFQTIKDIWDGTFRTIVSAFNNANDITLSVAEEDYESTNTYTFWNSNSFSSAHTLDFGFAEKMTALNLIMGGTVQTTASVTTISYWDGDSWVSVGTISDGTSKNGATLGQTGIISWQPPSAEFKTNIHGESKSYYYRLTVSATLGETHLDAVFGVPVQENIGQYKFPLFSKNRTFLCSRQDKDKNSVLISATNQPDVYNGDDSTELHFGDDKELTAGIGLFSRLASNIYDITLFFKRQAMFGLSGFSPDEFQPYTISETIGCVAPLTLKSDTIRVQQGGTRPITIWQATDGIYIFDNTSPIRVSKDIGNFFDKNESASNRLHPDYMHLSVGDLDIDNKEYIWLFADGNSSGTLNREFHLDLERLKFFEVPRAGSKFLQCSFQVSDTTGNIYNYGALDTGYIERLENGTDMDGTEFEQSFKLGDIAPVEGQIFQLSQILKHKLIMKDTGTSANVAVTHYGDGDTTGTSLDSSVDPTNSGKRFADVISNTNKSISGHVFHSTKYSMTSSDKNPAFHPLYLAWKVNPIGEDKD